MLGNAPVIVADRCNGAALPDADGPFRIVAAGDNRDPRHWILETHLVSPDRRFGGFYERLLEAAPNSLFASIRQDQMRDLRR